MQTRSQAISDSGVVRRQRETTIKFYQDERFKHQDLREKALGYLRKALDNPQARFRDGQWESIKALLSGQRVLVVQRTGWGKSMVYFIATKLLRDKGLGPTILISPLLSLMRNQIDAAQRVGVRPVTINSTNQEEWDAIKCRLYNDDVDILLISPERLANMGFYEDVLSKIAYNPGLVVVDEAHCISDWGHDFRPDYRRIVRIVEALPKSHPVLATTATANNRVVADVESQLGSDIFIQRGSLVRKSLRLQNISLPSKAARLAWLAQTIPSLPGSGIVYTLTVDDSKRVASWLSSNGISAKPYHRDSLDRESLEQQLLQNEVKVLVATVALGMGFDKPDLGFVIHYQRPSSVVHYYQQVGRAGRAVDEAYGILLSGEEDDDIINYFIRKAFPPQYHVKSILSELKRTGNGLSISQIERSVNLKRRVIEKTLKFLSVESPSPVAHIGSSWNATPAASGYVVDQKHIDAITGIRRAEQAQMQDYVKHKGCLIAFLQSALDDPTPTSCRKCKNCSPDLLLDETYNNEQVNQAGIFLYRNYQVIKQRKQWPSSNLFTTYAFKDKTIPPELQAEPGRVLSIWKDDGWGRLVANGKCPQNGKPRHFGDELVHACVKMVHSWSPKPFPKWVTCVPSLSEHADLVPDFAHWLADALGLPFIPCVEKILHNKPQKLMENSYQQAKNLDGVFKVTSKCPGSECFLVDDMVDSRWTFTVISALLRQSGCAAVYPLALAKISH